jgi:YjbE family integral membrane protein
MDILVHSAFWLGLAKIIWVNMLLSGDNAVVIALAARALQPAQQKQAVIWGSVAAIVMRVVLTIFAVQMLQWPWLKLVGAVLLIWVGVKLLEEEQEGAHIKQSSSPFEAIKTILIADLIMSLDNVLAVAAAADGAPAEAKLILLAIGLALSIPIVIFGSSIVLKLMERFPIIITLGAMLLGWIAGEMLGAEQKLQDFVQVTPTLHYALAIGGALLVLGLARLKLFAAANKKDA